MLLTDFFIFMNNCVSRQVFAVWLLVGMIMKLFVLQLNDLETEFESLPPGKPMQTRFLRSQQDLKAKMLERQMLGADQSSNQNGENIM